MLMPSILLYEQSIKFFLLKESKWIFYSSESWLCLTRSIYIKKIFLILNYCELNLTVVWLTRLHKINLFSPMPLLPNLKMIFHECPFPHQLCYESIKLNIGFHLNQNKRFLTFVISSYYYYNQYIWKKSVYILSYLWWVLVFIMTYNHKGTFYIGMLFSFCYHLRIFL